MTALNSGADGIQVSNKSYINHLLLNLKMYKFMNLKQVDLDDGHCPTWRNQILAHYNVFRAVRNDLPNTCSIENAPALIFRPRAWNMTENHMMVSFENF